MSSGVETEHGRDKIIGEPHCVEIISTELEHLEKGEESSASGASILINLEQRIVAEKRLVRKLDMRLMPMVVLLFMLNSIDKMNVSNARLKGLEKDLGLSDIQFDAVLAVAFATYTVAQIPLLMFLNRVKRPSWFIATFAVLWGLTCLLTGITHDFGSIVVCRLVLGSLESTCYPGAIYLLSRWYTRKELTFRSALLFSGLLISSAFGSLFAAGIISAMEGKGGIHGWRWLFLVEGAITICVGFISAWVLPDYPASTRRLSSAERRIAQARLAEEVAEADEDREGESILTGLKLACKDVKVPIFGLMTGSIYLGSSFITFFPTLAATLGFNSTISLLLAAPPWIFATIICCLNAFHADKTGERFFHFTAPCWAAIVGYIIAVSTLATGARYVSMFLMACGSTGAALAPVWVANVIPRPPAKRAASIAVANAFANVGILVGSFVWKEKWEPAYRPSMFIGIAALILSILMAFVMRCILIHDNKKLEKSETEAFTNASREHIEELARLEGITVKEALRMKRGYRYLY